MTEPEYRQDDRTDTGYCPKCGAEVTTVFVDGAGWCPDHGRVWCDWTPRTASGAEDERHAADMEILKETDEYDDREDAR